MGGKIVNRMTPYTIPARRSRSTEDIDGKSEVILK